MIYRNPDLTADIPDCSFPEAVLRHADRLGDKPAFIEVVSGRFLTYTELKDRVLKTAEGLRELGVRPGDVVMLLAPNSIEFVVAFYAIDAAGATVAPVSPLATVPEIERQARQQRPSFFISIEARASDIAQATQTVRIRGSIVIGEHAGMIPFQHLEAGSSLPQPIKVDSARTVAALLSSSGTTGTPKSVMLTHRNLVSMACLKAGPHEIKQRDVVTGQLPLFHAFGVMITLAAVPYAGATSLLLQRFELETYLASIQGYRATRSYAPPPILLQLAKNPLVDSFDLSSLEIILSGAAPLGADIEAVVRRRVGCQVKQGYGLTECVPLLLGPDDAPESKQGSVGFPALNTEVRVVNLASGLDCSPGEQGEIWARGPQAFLGYLDDPDATRVSLDSAGWVHTGDLGYVDDDGYFYIVDRLKELIKYKAHQVAPAELEALLLTHPAVADAAVVRYPDDAAGEIPKAFVVVRSPIDAVDLMAWVADRVSPYKRIRLVEFVDVIPKSASGKILRRELIERDRVALAAPV
jgi:acyl-CoA synthetase (AMP-forming)/AMP-acid ligase II